MTTAILRRMKGLVPANHIQKFRKIMITIALFALVLSTSGQTLRYDVVYKGDIIGNMVLHENKAGDHLYLKTVSEVRLNLLLNIHVYTEEKAVFKNGKLIYASIYRKVNDKVKVNNEITATGDIYQISSDGKISTINNTSIEHYLNLLYNHEPVNVRKVYSANFKQFVEVKAIEAHKYKVELPDGNYNYYYYTNGICQKVEVNTSRINVQMQLKE